MRHYITSVYSWTHTHKIANLCRDRVASTQQGTHEHIHINLRTYTEMEQQVLNRVPMNPHT